MDIHVFLHSGDQADLEAIKSQLTSLTLQGVQIMATLQQVADDVAGEKTVIEGISTLIDGLQTQLAAALSGTTIPPAVQAQIDQVFADAEANKASLAAALLKGTTPVVPTTVPPVVTPPAA